MPKRTLVAAVLLVASLAVGLARASGTSSPLLYLRIEGVGGEVDMQPTPTLVGDCTSYCLYSFPSSTLRIQLTAHSFNGRFVNWAAADSRHGAPCSGTNPVCTFQPRISAMALRVYFSPVMVIVHATDGGSASIDGRPCGIGCGLFDVGAVAHLSATQARDFQFTGWSSMCSGNPCSYTVRVNHETTALFRCSDPSACSAGSPITTSVAVRVQVRGPGHVIGSHGLRCPGRCVVSFELGEQVNLQAVADAGHFRHWQSNLVACGSSACQLPAVKTVNGYDPSVVASFG